MNNSGYNTVLDCKIGRDAYQFLNHLFEKFKIRLMIDTGDTFSKISKILMWEIHFWKIQKNVDDGQTDGQTDMTYLYMRVAIT